MNDPRSPPPPTPNPRGLNNPQKSLNPKPPSPPPPQKKKKRKDKTLDSRQIPGLGPFVGREGGAHAVKARPAVDLVFAALRSVPQPQDETKQEELHRVVATVNEQRSDRPSRELVVDAEARGHQPQTHFQAEPQCVGEGGLRADEVGKHEGRDQ